MIRNILGLKSCFRSAVGSYLLLTIDCQRTCFGILMMPMWRSIFIFPKKLTVSQFAGFILSVCLLKMVNRLAMAMISIHKADLSGVMTAHFRVTLSSKQTSVVTSAHVSLTTKLTCWRRLRNRLQLTHQQQHPTYTRKF